MVSNMLESSYNIKGVLFPISEWTESETLKGISGQPFSVYCNKHGDTACMHFVKGFKNIHNFYCSAELFSTNVNTGNIITMSDENGENLRVVPSGYHNFSNLFCIEDLFSADVCVAELELMRKD